jgi:hypothetical protein
MAVANATCAAREKAPGADSAGAIAMTTAVAMVRAPAGRVTRIAVRAAVATTDAVMACITDTGTAAGGTTWTADLIGTADTTAAKAVAMTTIATMTGAKAVVAAGERAAGLTVTIQIAAIAGMGTTTAIIRAPKVAADRVWAVASIRRAWTA